MEHTTVKQNEAYIANMFNGQSGHFNKNDTKGLSKTAEMHVKQISDDKDLHIALDVGSGTAGIMEGLLEKNLDYVYGVDLSPKMIEYAQERLAKNGYSDKAKIDNISFLDYTCEQDPDAISLHQVLCCHPDRQGMLEKAISAHPKLIVLTIPRRRFFLRGAAGFLSLVRKVKKGFRFYVHDITKIDEQLSQSNYQLIDVFKTKMWITRTYRYEQQ